MSLAFSYLFAVESGSATRQASFFEHAALSIATFASLGSSIAAVLVERLAIIA
jgi:hypothetical protein